MLIRRLELALLIGVGLCVSLVGCRFEIAVDPGTLGPSVDEVRSLLEQDRVRQAKRRAEELFVQLRGPQTDLVTAWALWRNGEVRQAETRFRRAAGAGMEDGFAGLALVRASVGDWRGARELAAAALQAGGNSGVAHAVLASAAWWSQERDAAVGELRAWGAAERGTRRGAAASAMAAAVDRLTGPPHAWSGDAAALRVRRMQDGSLAVEANVAGRPTLLAIDLTFRQSLVSEEVAESAGLSLVENQGSSSGPSASDRWPAILTARQAACSSIALGSVEVGNIVLAVGPAPEGVGGVIGMDILAGLRWSFDARRQILIVAPPDQGDAVDELSAEGPMRVVAWLNARLIYEGLGVQLLLFPRVQGEVIPAGINLGDRSQLESDLLPVAAGSGASTVPLRLGGWTGEPVWRPASLVGWAADGGVAPSAVLGGDLLGQWTLHWLPETRQIRIEEPVSVVGQAKRD